MDPLQVLTISVKAAIASCDVNGDESLIDKDDAFMRGFAAAHRKLGAYLTGALKRIEDSDDEGASSI